MDITHKLTSNHIAQILKWQFVLALFVMSPKKYADVWRKICYT